MSIPLEALPRTGRPRRGGAPDGGRFHWPNRVRRTVSGPAPAGGPGRGGAPVAGRYVGAIDGVRALAVVAVILFHVGVPWMGGGFVGVDLFFVISGYLIGAQLWSRTAHSDSVGLRAFWVARARRLLPTLVVVLVAAATATALVAGPQLGRFRGDLLASMTFTTNWWFVFHQVPYFETFGRPSALQHLWSLAIEEQFYLLLPLLFVAFVAVFPVLARRRRAMLAVVLVLAAASAAWMSLGAHLANVPYESDGSRFYFGTDSHVFGLLLGVALAVWRNGDGIGAPRHLRPEPRRGRWVGVLGWLGVAVLAAVAVTASEHGKGLYFWQLQLVAVAALAVVAAASRVNALSAVLAWGPLRAVGRRSYGLYLWHWPVVVFTRPGEDVRVDGWALVLLQVALTFALAEGTYRWVEQPVRVLGWRGYLRKVSQRSVLALTAPRFAASVATGVFAVVLAVPNLAGCVNTAAEQQRGAYQVAVSSAADGAAAPGTTAAGTTAAGSTVPGAPGTTTGLAPAPPSTTDPAPTLEEQALSATGQDLRPISAFGDSVMQGATPALVSLFPNLLASTAVSRQGSAIMDEVQAAARGGYLADTVVIHMGTNGYLEKSKVEATVDMLADRKRVVLVNVYADRVWASEVNAIISEMAGRHRNIRIADWRGTAAANTWALAGDGIHVGGEGAALYAQAVQAALR